MRIFTPLYDKAMVWSRHRHAPAYLGGLSFAESSFFPVPPDVMLAPMSLARPQRAWYFAGLTTVTSVLGGILGYVIGLYFFEALEMERLLQQWGYWDKFQKVSVWFDEWGFWAVFLAGFTPIPYKLFTISAGVIAMPLLPFVVASIVGRGGRFFLVSGLMVWGGAAMEEKLRHFIDWLGWALVLLIIIAFFVTCSG